MCKIFIVQSNLLKSGIILIFHLILFMPLKAFPQECKILFEVSPLNEEKYSTTQLEQAMESTSYSQIIKQYPEDKR